MVWDVKKNLAVLHPYRLWQDQEKHKVFRFWAAYLDSYGYTNWKVSDRGPDHQWAFDLIARDLHE